MAKQQKKPSEVSMTPVQQELSNIMYNIGAANVPRAVAPALRDMLLENVFRLTYVIDKVVSVKSGKSPSIDIGAIISSMATTIQLLHKVDPLSDEEMKEISTRATQSIDKDFLDKMKVLMGNGN